MPDIDFTGVRSDVRAAFQHDFTQVRKLAARRTRRTRLRAGAAVALIAVAAIAGLRLVPVSGGHDPQPPAAPPGAESSPDVPYHHAEVPFPATAASADRLYLPYYDCLGDACRAGVAVSGDGGRSWDKVLPTGLPEPVSLLGIVPLGPLEAVLRVTDGSPTVSDLVTDDGGRTWRPVSAGPPIGSIPAAGRLIWEADYWTTSDRTGTVLAVDPKTGDAHPLTNQPSIARGRLATAPDQPADIWVGGADASGQAAVAVSHDAGATWATHSFPLPGNAIVATVGASTGYAVVNPEEPAPAASDWDTFRSRYAVSPTRPAVAALWITHDGGTNWEPASATPPAGEVTGAAMLPDGSLLLRIQSQDGKVANYRSVDDGQSLATAQGGPGASITVIGPNAYFATDLPADSYAVTGIKPNRAYLSTDDRHWTTVTYPQLP